MEKRTNNSIPDRLRALPPYTLRPEPLWEMRRVCEAFMVPTQRGYPVIPKSCKRRHCIKPKDWRMRRIIGLVTRDGIEALACRFNRQFSRAEIMAAVEESIHVDTD